MSATGYGPAELKTPPPVTRREPLIIEGEVATAVRRPAYPRPNVRRYGVAAGAAALVAALVAIVLLAPGVLALPGIGLLAGNHPGIAGPAATPPAPPGDR